MFFKWTSFVSIESVVFCIFTGKYSCYTERQRKLFLFYSIFFFLNVKLNNKQKKFLLQHKKSFIFHLQWTARGGVYHKLSCSAILCPEAEILLQVNLSDSHLELETNSKTENLKLGKIWIFRDRR